MRTLPAGLAAAIGASGQQPNVQVTLADTTMHFSQYASGGAAGRHSCLVTSAGTLLRAITSQGADPNTVQISRIPNATSVFPTPSQWTSGRVTVTSNAKALGGAALVQTGSTIRLFYSRSADNLICYRDSTDDGVTWSAETAIPTIPYPAFPNFVFCFGIFAIDINTVIQAAAAFNDNNAAAILSRSTFSAGSWGAWDNEGPATPNGWSLVRGLAQVTVSGTTYVTSGVCRKQAVKGISANILTVSGSSYSGWVSIQDMDPPNMGVSLQWPGISYVGGLFYASVSAVDDGSTSGNPSTITSVYTSTDGVTWKPLASLGYSFQYGTTAMMLGGQLAVFDASTVSAASPASALADVSQDILSLEVREREDQPAQVSMVISNEQGQYNALPTIVEDAIVTISLGYGSNLVQTHTLRLMAWTYSNEVGKQQVQLEATDCRRSLLRPAERTSTYTNQTVGYIAQQIAAQAGIQLAALPGTAQFSQTIPCFIITQGEAWLHAMTRLSKAYGFHVIADGTPQLRIYEKGSGDASTWTYGQEALALSVRARGQQPNVIRVSGPPSTSSMVWSQQVDAANIASTGRIQLLLEHDWMLDTGAKCGIKAALLLRDAQAANKPASLLVAPNMAHELGDVITFSDSQLGIAAQKGRIIQQHIKLDFISSTFTHQITCEGP